MTVFILFNTDQQKIIWTSYFQEICEEKMHDLSKGKLSYKDGKYYCPYVIYDTFVHMRDCMCETCTGLSDE